MTREKRFSRWNTEEFFATGRADVAQFIADTEALGLRKDWQTALDFGCGLGRLTAALHDYVPDCTGIDIAENMINQARAYHPECRFMLNRSDKLPIEDSSFDLVFSLIVLQHLGSQQAVLSYLREFARVLRPGGLLAFQLPPSLTLRQRFQPRRYIYDALRKLGFSSDLLYKRLGVVSMFVIAVPEADVKRTLIQAGLRYVCRSREDATGPTSSMYYFTR